MAGEGKHVRTAHYVLAGTDRFRGKREVFGSRVIDTKVSAQDTNGGLYVSEVIDVQKGGPARHLHHEQEEWFYVVEGEYIIEVGEERYELGPGDSVLAPRTEGGARVGIRWRGDRKADRRLAARGPDGGVLRRTREVG